VTDCDTVDTMNDDPTTGRPNVVVDDGSPLGGRRKLPIYMKTVVVATTAVGLSGFEPLTSSLSGMRSNQLSYRPMSG
jgi:hypothetical protein